MIMKNKYIFLLFLSVFGVFVFSPLEAVAVRRPQTGALPRPCE